MGPSDVPPVSKGSQRIGLGPPEGGWWLAQNAPHNPNPLVAGQLRPGCRPSPPTNPGGQSPANPPGQREPIDIRPRNSTAAIPATARHAFSVFSLAGAFGGGRGLQRADEQLQVGVLHRVTKKPLSLTASSPVGVRVQVTQSQRVELRVGAHFGCELLQRRARRGPVAGVVVDAESDGFAWPHRDGSFSSAPRDDRRPGPTRPAESATSPLELSSRASSMPINSTNRALQDDLDLDLCDRGHGETLALRPGCRAVRPRTPRVPAGANRCRVPVRPAQSR